MELKSKLIYLSIHSLGDGFTVIVIGLAQNPGRGRRARWGHCTAVTICQQVYLSLPLTRLQYEHNRETSNALHTLGTTACNNYPTWTSYRTHITTRCPYDMSTIRLKAAVFPQLNYETQILPKKQNKYIKKQKVL